ncbi:MAG: GAF domain-containing protein [Myxococcota bacterium]
MEYTITALNGDSVKVESENWMTAMGKALAFFDIEIGSIGRLTCSPARDGSVFIEDPTGSRSWMVRQHAPDIAVRVTPRALLERWEPVREAPTANFPARPLGAGFGASAAAERRRPERRAEAASAASPPPEIDMPLDSSLRAPTLDERAEELAAAIGPVTRERGGDLVLEAIREYVRADAACVAVGTLNDAALRVVSAEGPIAGSVVGRQVGFGEGLIGMCFDMRGTLLVNDVAGDTLHLDQLERQPPTLAVMCVPLLDDEGNAFGVVQLLNTPDRQFTRSHTELVEAFARTFAETLARR